MPDITRRRALTAAAAVAATASAVALAGPAASAAPAAGHHDHTAPGSFDEVYKGRRIQGGPASGGGHHHEHGGGYEVLVDGVQLHVMRNADGTWISVVSHYDPVATPRAAARAAVDELQGAPLLPFPAN
ncbi:tyrosinase cofactor [Streptomyces sp. 5-8]|uniref:Tyrosinase cofactor n=1 Tax=Streptomyces musisoli TaxID=2802280 RepID=A0ABS1P981_9ACTN|nr:MULTISPECIES: tyrosinase cofactor [Streptomyces]MBL1108935.1 tyrosinase cofactor [Streptomyces musisoli]MBY8845286.1 tyrosinase cofactor [Streptomyces sp. SP2-10]